MKAITRFLVWAIAGVMLGWSLVQGQMLMLCSLFANSQLPPLPPLPTHPVLFVVGMLTLGGAVNYGLCRQFAPRLLGRLFLTLVLLTFAWGYVQHHDYQLWLVGQAAEYHSLVRNPIAWALLSHGDHVVLSLTQERYGYTFLSPFPRWLVAGLMWVTSAIVLVPLAWRWRCRSDREQRASNETGD